ncbi:MAG: GNAT family N-acetyltransferase [Planctomycetota bacterium]|jgi:ribosomal-protein-alanine N-acetyltransferase
MRWIETERLRMRPLGPGDLEAVYRLWAHPDVRRFLFDGEKVSPAWVAAELERNTACFAAHGWGQWAVLEGDTLIGFCGYRFFHDPPERQLVFGIDPAHWGRGLATEAARAMVRHGFRYRRFERIIASADAPNAASIRVLEKAGFRFDRRLWLRGRETVYYSRAR